MNNDEYRRTRHDRGFSLAELIVAVAIVSILATIAVMQIRTVVRASREARGVANLKTLAAAQMTFYSTQSRFAYFDELYRGGYLATGQLARAHPEGGPQGSASEAISDGTYLFTVRFSLEANGMTVDADPARSMASQYRRYRIRFGRTARSRGGSESVILVAEASEDSPPAAAYRLLGS